MKRLQLACLKEKRKPYLTDLFYCFNFYESCYAALFIGKKLILVTCYGGKYPVHKLTLCWARADTCSEEVTSFELITFLLHCSSYVEAAQRSLPGHCWELKLIIKNCKYIIIKRREIKICWWPECMNYILIYNKEICIEKWKNFSCFSLLL